MRVIPALNSAGHYYHPYVGIEYDPRYTDGVHVVTVATGGPAYSAGLQSGDVIKEVDGLQISRGDDFIIYLERYKSPGDTLNLNVSRGGTSHNLVLTLGERPV
jgi:S1-C subfamily serine protease